MLSKIKVNSPKVLLLSIVAIILSSCGVRLEKAYYDTDSQTDVLPTSNKILAPSVNGERVVGWVIARRDSIFLELQLQYSRINHKRFYVPQGNYVSVEFSDGTSSPLMNNSYTKSWHGNSLGDDDNIANAFIPLSDDIMKILLSKTITALDIQTSVSNSRFIIKPNKDLDIKKMIRLMRPDL